MIHLLGATWMGAVALSFFVGGFDLAGEPSGLFAREAPLPLFLEVQAYAIAAGSFALAAYEACVMTAAKRSSAGGAPCMLRACR